jgi:hypothetical protein
VDSKIRFVAVTAATDTSVKTSWKHALPDLVVLDCGRLQAKEGNNTISFIRLSNKKHYKNDGHRIAETLKPYLKEKNVGEAASNTVIFLKDIKQCHEVCSSFRFARGQACLL